MTDIYTKIEFDKDFEASPNEKVFEVKSPLPYAGAPSRKFSSYENFLDTFVEDYECSYNNYQEDDQISEDRLTPEELRNKLYEVVTASDMKYVYTHISYPG